MDLICDGTHQVSSFHHRLVLRSQAFIWPVWLFAQRASALLFRVRVGFALVLPISLFILTGANWRLRVAFSCSRYQKKTCWSWSQCEPGCEFLRHFFLCDSKYLKRCISLGMLCSGLIFVFFCFFLWPIGFFPLCLLSFLYYFFV
ncbi:unnamed protein product [Discosporangium mesarthrocarpum]